MAELSPLGAKALRLRNADPTAFEEFTAELDNYYRDLMQQIVQAPGHDVFQAQGRAQSVFALLRILVECHIERKPKPPAPSV
jgi:hypothetical protein